MTPAALILGAAAVAIGAAGAWTVQAWRYQGQVSQLKRGHEQAITDQLVQNGKRLARLADQQHAQVQTHVEFVERERVRIKTITQQVETLVDRPVYRDQCFDDDGLRLVAQAIAGVDDRAPTAPHTGPAVPAAHPPK